MEARDEERAADLREVHQRDLLFGVTSLRRGILIERLLRAADVDAALDVGQQNWPATIHVGTTLDGDPFPRDQVRWLVKYVDPESSQLRFFRRRAESVRVACMRHASATPAHPPSGGPEGD